MSYKNFVVSDVHDHCYLLKKALKNNGFDENNCNHRLILCGDAFSGGPQPGEMFEFLKELNDKKRLIFIYGNHDIELLDNIKKGKFGRDANRKCTSMVVKYFTNNADISDDDIIKECKKIGFVDFLENVPVWYYENEKYIFTHGFIPTEKNSYKENWRASSEKEWRNAAGHGDAMKLSMRYGVCEPGKIIVSGHYSAARCFKMKNATDEDWNNKIYKDVTDVPEEGFKTFFCKTFIAMDASTKKTGFVNCIVIDD